MRSLIFYSLLMGLVSLLQTGPTADGSSVTVLAFKWSKAKQVVEKLNDPPTAAPARGMIPANKNFERNVRINASPGARDPNADTVDGRSAAIEQAVQESRSSQPKPVDGFSYRVKIQNAGSKTIQVIFWEYQFTDAGNADTTTRRQFLCGVEVRPEKQKEIQAFSVAGPSEVVNVNSLTKDLQKGLQEKVVINRVEYADGSIWQRKDWNFAEIRLTYARALGTPWGTEMCRSL